MPGVLSGEECIKNRFWIQSLQIDFVFGVAIPQPLSYGQRGHPLQHGSDEHYAFGKVLPTRLGSRGKLLIALLERFATRLSWTNLDSMPYCLCLSPWTSLSNRTLHLSEVKPYLITVLAASPELTASTVRRHLLHSPVPPFST